MSFFFTRNFFTKLYSCCCQIPFCKISPATIWTFKVLLLQGEMVVARFASWPPDDLDKDSGALFKLLFGDGSQKMLAAMTCWVAMLLVWRAHGEDGLSGNLVHGMISSFLKIATTVRATETKGSCLENVINRIVTQNVNSKVQPISSFAWSSILKTSAGAGTSFEDALNEYNNHPTVLAHDRGDTGVGSIALDGRKRQGVRNWLDKCCEKAYQEVLVSTHDIAFGLGAFGESFSYTNSCFLRSTVTLDTAGAECPDAPLSGEGYVEVSRPKLQICPEGFFWPVCNYVSRYGNKFECILLLELFKVQLTCCLYLFIAWSLSLFMFESVIFVATIFEYLANDALIKFNYERFKI